MTVVLFCGVDYTFSKRISTTASFNWSFVIWSFHFFFSHSKITALFPVQFNLLSKTNTFFFPFTECQYTFLSPKLYVLLNVLVLQRQTGFVPFLLVFPTFEKVRAFCSIKTLPKKGTLCKHFFLLLRQQKKNHEVLFDLFGKRSSSFCWQFSITKKKIASFYRSSIRVCCFTLKSFDARIKVRVKRNTMSL